MFRTPSLRGQSQLMVLCFNNRAHLPLKMMIGNRDYAGVQAIMFFCTHCPAVNVGNVWRNDVGAEFVVAGSDLSRRSEWN